MGPNYDIVKELQNINKNLQSINMALVKRERSDNETNSRDDDPLSICKDCQYYYHRIGDVRFCVHRDSCRRAYRLLTKENE